MRSPRANALAERFVRTPDETQEDARNPLGVHMANPDLYGTETSMLPRPRAKAPGPASS